MIIGSLPPGLVDVIYSLDGKEILTPTQLDIEIKQQVVTSGGRISVSELSTLLNVGLSHVENRLSFITSGANQAIFSSQGELITTCAC